MLNQPNVKPTRQATPQKTEKHSRIIQIQAREDADTIRRALQSVSASEFVSSEVLA